MSVAEVVVVAVWGLLVFVVAGVWMLDRFDR